MATAAGLGLPALKNAVTVDGGHPRRVSVVPAPYEGCLIIPSTALISTAAIPTGMAIFHPMFMSWS